MKDFESAFRDIQTRDPRFARDAYLFVFEALHHTQRRLKRQHHVTGQELVEGLRALGLKRFGFLAKTVFHEWGVRTTDDFGRIVFNLVDANLMGRQESDTSDDFAGGFDFTAAFEDGFTLDTNGAAEDEGEDAPEEGKGEEAEGEEEGEGEGEGEKGEDA